MPSLKEQLKELLISSKIITQEQLDKALEIQKEKAGRLSDIIVEQKLVKEEVLMSILSKGLGLPLIDLKRFKIDPDIVKIIPVNIARHYQIIPVSKIEDMVTLAMADPLNIFAIDDVQALTGYKINPIISTGNDIRQAIEASYPDLTKNIVEGLVKELGAPSIELINAQKEAGPSDEELSHISCQPPAIKVTNMLLESAVNLKSSDILIEPFTDNLRLRFRIDGILKEQKALPKNMHLPIVSRIKVISGLDIAEHRLPQDGRFKAQIIGKEVDFRISIIPSNFGEKVAIRILDKSQAQLDIEKLGFNEGAVSTMKKVSRLPHGMVLVCGPTGCGKTTTLYSVLKFVDSPEKNIVTVEDPLEYQLEGINQVTARPDIGLTFAAALRSILRQDPNIIMIGEIRDYETVDIAIKSALTGHLVLSTLHTTTAPGSIVRLVNMGVEPYLINASLVCVLAQRLVRKICPHCKEEYVIKKDILESLKLNLKEVDKPVFFRGKGCLRCLDTGYSGRVGIAEVLLLTPVIRELISGHSQEHIIKQQARKEGMQTLREDGVRLALSGTTTLEEVLRVTASD